jgi:hypothetical protein
MKIMNVVKPYFSKAKKNPGGDQSQNRENVYLLSLREVGSQEV